MLRRRQALHAAGWLAAPGVLRAQAGRPLQVVGILGMHSDAYSSGPQPANPAAHAFIRGLAEAGHRYGTDYTTLSSGIEGDRRRIAGAVQGMLQAPVAVIAAAGPFGPQLQLAGVRVPVVLCGSEDPVGQGLVRSLAVPGTMFTGLSNQLTELMPKRLDLLAELYPAPARLGVLRQATVPPDPRLDRQEVAWFQAAASAIGRDLDIVEIKVADDLPQLLQAARQRGVAGMMVSWLLDRRELLDEQALRAGIGLMWPFRSTSPTEELISYSTDFTAVWHRAAHYVDRILRGAHPGTLPMEQPTKIDLVINLRTAARLGVRVPQSLLLRASRVIE